MKFKLYMAIPVNFALWNRELWAGNTVDMNKLDTFYHKVIHRILKVRIAEVKDSKITNDQISLRFNKKCIKLSEV